MANSLIAPLTVSFDGGDANQHLVDVGLLGQSLQGTARIYNSVAHFWFHGVVPNRLVAPHMRFLAGPPGEGSLTYVVWLMMNSGTLAVYPQLLCTLGDLAIPQFVKAVFSKKAGRKTELDKALDTIADMGRQYGDLAKMMHDGHMTDKAALFGIVDKLTSTNGSALSNLAAPVGPSVKAITHFKATDQEYVVDEPTAEAFRAKEELIVGDELTYRGKLSAVDKKTGTCRFEPEDGSKEVRAKITDPSLTVPSNVYTHALDTAGTIEIKGKPVLRNGEITTLYISNAKPL